MSQLFNADGSDLELARRPRLCLLLVLIVVTTCSQKLNFTITSQVAISGEVAGNENACQDCNPDHDDLGLYIDYQSIGIRYPMHTISKNGGENDRITQ